MEDRNILLTGLFKAVAVQVQGSCKQLNPNETLTGVWPSARPLRACESSPHGNVD